jgi:hypothetical protein
MCVAVLRKHAFRVVICTGNLVPSGMWTGSSRELPSKSAQFRHLLVLAPRFFTPRWKQLWHDGWLQPRGNGQEFISWYGQCLRSDGESKLCPRTVHEGPQGEQVYSSTLSLTSFLVWECMQILGKLSEFNKVTLVYIHGQREGRQTDWPRNGLLKLYLTTSLPYSLV